MKLWNGGWKLTEKTGLILMNKCENPKKWGLEYANCILFSVVRLLLKSGGSGYDCNLSEDLGESLILSGNETHRKDRPDLYE